MDTLKQNITQTFRMLELLKTGYSNILIFCQYFLE